MRVLSHLLIILLGLGILGGVIGIGWGHVMGGKMSELSTIAATIVMMIFWSGVILTIYTNYIKPPREINSQLVQEAADYLTELLKMNSGLSHAVQEIRGTYPLVGEPRYRCIASSANATHVELETDSFIISLFANDGMVIRWLIKGFAASRAGVLGQTIPSPTRSDL